MYVGKVMALITILYLKSTRWHGVIFLQKNVQVTIVWWQDMYILQALNTAFCGCVHTAHFFSIRINNCSPCCVYHWSTVYPFFSVCLSSAFPILAFPSVRQESETILGVRHPSLLYPGASYHGSVGIKRSDWSDSNTTNNDNNYNTNVPYGGDYR